MIFALFRKTEGIDHGVDKVPTKSVKKNFAGNSLNQSNMVDIIT